MRLLEIVLVIINIGMLIIHFIGYFRTKKGMRFLPMVALIVFILHYFFEKPRWQLFPLYLTSLIFGLLFLMKPKIVEKSSNLASNLKRGNRKGGKGKIGIILSILIILSLFSGYTFPVYKMPAPTGNYLIGTQSFDLTDYQRDAIYSSKTQEKRKIKVQIWYPADETKGYDQVPWLEDGQIVARALAKEMKLPLFTLDQTALVKSHSYKDAPISSSEDVYPVIIISHGWTGFRNLHTDVAELLASQGYIVIGIDHTYGSQITAFNDGEIAFVNHDALPDRETTPEFLDFANKLVTTYGADISFVLNELENFNMGKIPSKITDKVDLMNIGLLGHSTGGGADVSVAINDSRIKALIGLDAWVEPIVEEELTKGLSMPSLFLRSSQWEEGYNNEPLYNLISRSKGETSMYQIEGTTHYDFTMVYMYSPLTRYLGFTGELNGRRSSGIQRDLILNFFDHVLKGKDINIEKVAQGFAELEKIK